MLYAVLSSVLLGSAWLLLLYLRKATAERAKAEAKNEALEDVFHDVYLAKTARDALAASHDSDSARKLRQKYTRK